jgi:hypothetical protein
LSEKRRFQGFISQKERETTHFVSLFSYIPGIMGAYLTPLTPFTTTPCPGTPPANNKLTKQFLSHPHGL